MRIIRADTPSGRLESAGRLRLGIADGLLLIAVCAALMRAFSGSLPHARAELDALYDSDYFGDAWKYLVTAPLLSLAIAFGVFARQRGLFWLAGLLVALSILKLAWDPIAQFVSHEHYFSYPSPSNGSHFAITCAAATFVLCLPYRLRGWRCARQRAKTARPS
jgi:hypothetical protein